MPATFDPRLLDAIERQSINNWEAIVWRATTGNSPILRPNVLGARWNPPDVEALYCSLDRDAAIAELEHLLGRQPVPVKAQRKVSRIRVKLNRVADLSSEAAIQSLGYEIADIGMDDHSLPNHLGAAVDWLRIPGALVPSLRFDAVNLVIYFQGIVPPHDIVDLKDTSIV